MPSWWHDLIRVTGETLETAHHFTTAMWAARGKRKQTVYPEPRNPKLQRDHRKKTPTNTHI